VSEKEGSPREEERYLYNRVKRSPYKEKRKSVLIMGMSDQWTGGIMLDI
jgi:hypothetical protein